MGRPKGSLNKPKNNKYEVSRKNDTVVLKINMETQIAGAPLTRDSNRLISVKETCTLLIYQPFIIIQ